LDIDKDYIKKEDAYFGEVQNLSKLNLKFNNSDFDFDNIYFSDAKKNVILKRLEEDDAFKRAWNRNYSAVFYDDIFRRLTNKSNFFIRYFGDPNSGKSFQSLYIAYLTTLLDFQYVNLFSTSQAQLYLAVNAHNASKNGESVVSKTYLNIDETQQQYGTGSGASRTYFDQLTEFIRALQICIGILNPMDTSSAEIQIETIAYTLPDDNGVRYTKSMLHYLIDKRDRIYRPLGYLVTKTPPQNFINSYLIQKNDFLKSFASNKNPTFEKSGILCDIIWNDLTEDNKSFMRSAFLMNKETYVMTLLRKAFSVFNLPSQETKNLIEEFKVKYFQDEIRSGWERRLIQMQNKISKATIPKAIKTPPDNIKPTENKDYDFGKLISQVQGAT